MDHIVARGRATERDANGRALRIAGTFRDISLERERDRDRQRSGPATPGESMPPPGTATPATPAHLSPGTTPRGQIE